jgi:hypothetical protein
MEEEQEPSDFPGHHVEEKEHVEEYEENKYPD